MPRRKFSVIIVGGGITGLSTLYHCKRNGINDICLIDTDLDSTQSSSLYAPPYVTQSWEGNITRLAHAFGSEDAQKLRNFGVDAYDHLVKYLISNKVTFWQNHNLRFLCSKKEYIEGERAVEILNNWGQAAYIHKIEKSQYGIYGVQGDGLKSAWVSPRMILDSLKTNIGRDSLVLGKVNEIIEQYDGTLQLKLDTKRKISCEMLVLAAHLGIANLLPQFEKVLIPVTDQYCIYKFASKEKREKQVTLLPEVGQVFQCQYGYEWGAFGPDHQLCLGGGRQLRLYAGIGQTNAQYDHKIEEQVKKNFLKRFSHIELQKNIEFFSGKEIIPCDEKPLLGPLPSNQRILIATGFINRGLSQGFFAGYCLSQLIDKGVSKTIPDPLSIQRLRSL